MLSDDVKIMIKLNSLIKREVVYEGLIHTVESETTADMLNKWSGSGGKFKVAIKPQKITLDFTNNLDEKELKNLLKLINNLGWFISAVLIFRSEVKWEKFNLEKFLKDDIDKRLLSFQLEAKYDIEVNVHDFDTLYHISPSIYKEKILTYGLIPKSKEKIFSHPDRVYFVDNDDDVNILLFQFQKLQEKTDFTIFEIDFKKCRRNNPSIRLFLDPNFRGAIYTLSNIPPQFIKDNGTY